MPTNDKSASFSCGTTCFSMWQTVLDVIRSQLILPRPGGSNARWWVNTRWRLKHATAASSQGELISHETSSSRSSPSGEEAQKRTRALTTRALLPCGDAVPLHVGLAWELKVAKSAANRRVRTHWALSGSAARPELVPAEHAGAARSMQIQAGVRRVAPRKWHFQHAAGRT